MVWQVRAVSSERQDVNCPHSLVLGIEDIYHSPLPSRIHPLLCKAFAALIHSLLYSLLIYYFYIVLTFCPLVYWLSSIAFLLFNSKQPSHSLLAETFWVSSDYLRRQQFQVQFKHSFEELIRLESGSILSVPICNVPVANGFLVYDTEACITDIKGLPSESISISSLQTESRSSIGLSLSQW